MANPTSEGKPQPGLALGTTLLGAIAGGFIGGSAGYRLGAAMLEEPDRSVENPLDDIVITTFDAIGSLLLVGAVTILVLCVGVAVGACVALRITKRQRSGATLLWCVVLQFAGVPLGFFVADLVESFAEDVAVTTGLAIVVLVVPVAARWLAVRYGPTTV